MRRAELLLALCLAACLREPGFQAVDRCDGIDADLDGRFDEADDRDDDGWATCAIQQRRADCDDADPLRHPGAREVCDGLDDDCDGVIPEWERDEDGDGLRGCDGDCDDGRADRGPLDLDGDGWSTCAGDCDDADPARAPGRPEACDGIDNDCDGLAAGESDADVDGERACAGDCDDADPAIRSADHDGDGLGGCGPHADCDDSDSAVGAAGLAFADADGDGAGDPASPVLACPGEPGTSPRPDDCDDADPARSPRAAEVCDGLDDDCDGLPDDGLMWSAWSVDTDGDGWGGPLDVAACAQPADGVERAGDCDDLLPEVSPEADETCNGRDDDCDGLIDEHDAAGAPTWFADADGDGFGDPALPWTACLPPPGFAGTGDDCDDDASAVHPQAVEPGDCDGVDEDCDPLTAECP